MFCWSFWSKYFFFSSLSILQQTAQHGQLIQTSRQVFLFKISGTITISSNGSPYGSYYETTYSTSFTTAPSVVLSIPTIDISLTPPSLLLWKVNLPQVTNLTHLKVSMNHLSIAWRNFKVSYLGFIGLNYLKTDFI